ncbi:hypothetical protein RHSIM_Rhsim13G0005300 [Rhododendron simsii]|uniref:Uncharacterized protein n=1 Tax=Rhododendron simsii TaxID=118357 RepID=A0A834L7J9_RHOSS|nr:hypothetical protein RHSIM_Rhsim13G0005300 [Rhododendron simsii]
MYALSWCISNLILSQTTTLSLLYVKPPPPVYSSLDPTGSLTEPESTATVIDARGNRLQINVPITAAEIMLDEPGHVVSRAQLIRKTGRIPVMKADEELSAEEVYLVVPASRARCKVSESEMAMIDSACEKRRQKGRGSKVLPAATEGSGEKVEGSDVIKEGNITGLPGHQLASRRTWMPALEPISEGIWNTW